MPQSPLCFEPAIALPRSNARKFDISEAIATAENAGRLWTLAVERALGRDKDAAWTTRASEFLDGESRSALARAWRANPPEIAKKLRGDTRLEGMSGARFGVGALKFVRSHELPPLTYVDQIRMAGDGPVRKTPALSKSQEQLLFAGYNYFKHRAAKEILSRFDGSADKVDRIVHFLSKAEEIRDYLVRSNLGLPISISKRIQFGQTDPAEAFSEAMFALGRAAEEFHPFSGYKFSTYAVNAIIRSILRRAKKDTRDQRLSTPDSAVRDLALGGAPSREHAPIVNAIRKESTVVRDVKRAIAQAELSDVEQCVLLLRFGIGDNELPDLDNPHRGLMTLEQVGEIIGVTKERVRQIQNVALKKLRQALGENYMAERN